MAKTVSDVLIETLAEWGVDTIFGIPGDGINGIMEALRTHQDRVRFIQVRHEEAAAFAACSYAKFTGRLGVCLATSGPGAIHLLNGLYDAKLDGAPVLALTGQQESDLLGLSYQQEVDLLSLYKDVAAFNQAVQGASDVFNLVNTACRTALSKRTVAHINLAIDYQTMEAKSGFYKAMGGPPRTPNQIDQPPAGFYSSRNGLPKVAPIPTPELLRAAADVLNAGTKVAIVAGHGALDAGDELEQAADLLAAPIVKPLLGKGVVPDDSPFTTGGIGLLGTRPSEEALEECDTVLMVGTSFPYVAYLPKPSQARGVQIDVDETRLGLRFPIEVGLVGDAGATMRALLPLLQRKADRAFLEKAQEGMKAWNAQLDAEGTRTDVPMKPEVVAHTLEKLVAPDAIICGDSGTNTIWIGRNFRLKRGQKFSLSGNLATMAPGLPYAVGAQVAFPDRQVIAFVGDGGFTMLMGEVLTAVKYRLPIKVIIIKNNVLGQIKWEQIVFLGNPEYGVELQSADFAAWARAAGAEGFCVERPDEIEETMRRFLAVPGPAVLEAVVDPNEPPMPPKVSAKQVKHFAEALVKGQPDGARIALTAFRDKIDQLI
ncbi:MAG TPA: thiamine pyrophosphate-dependent enzyme [Chloroflexota bacterium]|nr:thiamine pyrophosphate-dependent enzyme [Chloroflexota bacterium]